MISSLIEVSEEKIFYKNEIYKFSIENIKKLNFGKRRKVLILGEDLYIKKVELNKGVKANEGYIENIIERAFGSNDDYLFDYNILKSKSEIIIYAIKGGLRIRELCDGCESLNIIPIQIYFLNKLKKDIKEKEWEALFTYRENNYYIFYKDGYILRSIVESDMLRFIEKYLEIEKEHKVTTYLDNRISSCFDCKDSLFIIKDFEEILNEKYTHKQRFFAKRICN